MSVDDHARLLARSSLRLFLDAEERRALSTAARLLHVPARGLLYDAGDHRDAFFMVVEGRFVEELGGTASLEPAARILLPFQWAGCHAVLGPGRRRAALYASVPGRILHLPVATARTALGESAVEALVRWATAVTDHRLPGEVGPFTHGCAAVESTPPQAPHNAAPNRPR